MTRRPLLLLGLTALLSVACVRMRVERAGDAVAPSVRNAHSVYLGAFGVTADGIQARQALRAEIERRELFQVVDTPEEADARIEGEVWLQRPLSGRGTEIRAGGEARLTDLRTGRLIWRHLYVPRISTPDAANLTPDDMLQRIVSQFCDELEMSAARGGGA